MRPLRAAETRLSRNIDTAMSYAAARQRVDAGLRRAARSRAVRRTNGASLNRAGNWPPDGISARGPTSSSTVLRTGPPARRRRRRRRCPSRSVSTVLSQISGKNEMIDWTTEQFLVHLWPAPSGSRIRPPSLAEQRRDTIHTRELADAERDPDEPVTRPRAGLRRASARRW